MKKALLFLLLAPLMALGQRPGLGGSSGGGGGSVTIASQTEAEQLSDNSKAMSALRVKQAIEASRKTPFSDAVLEWWQHPVATYLRKPYERVVSGGIAANGDIVVNEIAHSTGKVKRFKVGSAVVDDHCSPALWAMDDHRPIIAWTNHNNDNLVRFKVGSLSGDVTKWGPEIQLNLGSLSSYTQIHRLKADSDSLQDTFILFTRKNNTFWGIATFSVNQATGALTWTRAYRDILNGSTRQSYIITADAFNTSGNQVIRMAFSYNPAASAHDLHYLEIDVKTGAVSSIVTPALTGNIYSGSAILDTDLTPLSTVATGYSRRLFYVRSGPLPPAIAYADWDVTGGTYNAAQYKVTRYIPSSTITFDGVLTSTGNGYTGTASSAALNLNDFDAQVVCRYLQKPTQTVDFIRRRSTATNGWFAALTSDRRFVFSYAITGGTQRQITTTEYVPGAWTDEVGLGFRFRTNVGGNSVVYPIYSTDGGATWKELTPSGYSLGATAAPIANTNSLTVPNNSTNPSLALNLLVKSVRILNGSGVEVAGVNFTTATAGTGATTGTAGESWSQNSGSTIVRASSQTLPAMWMTEIFPDVAGPRIGYDQDANYLPGMAFGSTPSYDDVILIARRSADNTTSYIDRYTRSPGEIAYTKTQMVTGSTKLARPYAPINGGPISFLYNDFTLYGSDYTQYSGSMRPITD
ncbi:hypothetical protein [Larkinella soli]|uniref:hypothetical protein n=1 Tax=Larkinella soli TaxID=1770527 RepID=UPI000FFC9A10|nr:hypothetical protein [Larkinella soli]